VTSLSAPPDPLAAKRGLTSKGKGGKGKNGKGSKEKERKKGVEGFCRTNKITAATALLYCCMRGQELKKPNRLNTLIYLNSTIKV